MRKNNYFLVFLLVIVALFLICQIGCSETQATKLETPQNLTIDGNVLGWNSVNNATGYVVFVDNKEYECTLNNFDLSFLDEPKSYEVSVLALGDEILFTNSDWASINYVVEAKSEETLIPTKDLAYRRTPDGSGYSVSMGKANLSDTLIIPDHYNNLPIKEISDNAFTYYSIYGKAKNQVIKEVRLPEYLESIGSNAFAGCVEISAIDFPETLIEINERAFVDCLKLNDFTLPNTLEKLGTDAFANTKWLNEHAKGSIIKDNVFVLHNDNNENVAIPKSCRFIADSAFFYNKNVKSVYIPNGIKLGAKIFQASSIQSVRLPDDLFIIPQLSFFGCTNLREITIPREISAIEDGAFMGTSINSVDLPNTIQSIGARAFAKTLITTATMFQNISYGEGVFSGCKNLVKATVNLKILPKETFSECTSLVLVELSDNTEIIDNAFKNCVSLKEITLPENIKSVNGAFYGCESLKCLILPDGISEISDNTFSDCTMLESVVLPNGISEIRNGLFSGCTELRSVTLPDSLNEIDCSAFSGCTELETITFSKNLQSIEDYAFMNCSKINTITISKSLKNIGQEVFKNSCIKTVVFEEGVLRIPQAMFEYCTIVNPLSFPDSLKTIEMEAFKNSKVSTLTLPDKLENIGERAFLNCEISGGLFFGNGDLKIDNMAFSSCSLTEVTLPSTLVFEKGSGNTFNGCRLLKSVTINGLQKIADNMFFNCSALENLYIEEGTEEIGWGAFSGCRTLKNFILPDSLKTIGSSAFLNCENITSVTIPENLVEIGSSVFKNCKKLTKIVIPTGIEKSIIKELEDKSVYVTEVYYLGTHSDWCKNIETDYIVPEDVTIYFFAESKQETDSSRKYWHYVDEEIAIW